MKYVKYLLKDHQSVVHKSDETAEDIQFLIKDAKKKDRFIHLQREGSNEYLINPQDIVYVKVNYEPSMKELL